MNQAGSTETSAPKSGSGAAALLAAAAVCFALAVLAILGDKSDSIRSSLIFYEPTGPLSGVTTCAILVWLVTWIVLEWRWREKTIAVGRIVAIAFALLALSLTLTFPPVGDLFSRLAEPSVRRLRRVQTVAAHTDRAFPAGATGTLKADRGDPRSR